MHVLVVIFTLAVTVAGQTSLVTSTGASVDEEMAFCKLRTEGECVRSGKKTETYTHANALTQNAHAKMFTIAVKFADVNIFNISALYC